MMREKIRRVVVPKGPERRSSEKNMKDRSERPMGACVVVLQRSFRSFHTISFPTDTDDSLLESSRRPSIDRQSVDKVPTEHKQKQSHRSSLNFLSPWNVRRRLCNRPREDRSRDRGGAGSSSRSDFDLPPGNISD